MGPGSLFVESVPVPPEHENSASMFRASVVPERTTCLETAVGAPVHDNSASTFHALDEQECTT
jgi:hypothetical protein